MSITLIAAPARSRRSLADLSVKVKIMTAVWVAVLVALVEGVLGLSALSGASASAQQIYDRNLNNVANVGLIRAAMLQARLDLANHALSHDAATTTKYRTGFASDLQDVD